MTLASDLEDSQWCLLSRIKDIQDYQIRTKPAGVDYVALVQSLIDVFGSFRAALLAGRAFAQNEPEGFAGHLCWIISLALVTDGPNLGRFVKQVAQELRIGDSNGRSWPLHTIQHTLHSAMEFLHYDEGEKQAAFDGEFYAPRYPALENENGQARFDLDDYILVFGDALEIHLHHCLADLADFPAYTYWMSIFEDKKHPRYQSLVSAHLEVLFQRQVAVDDPRRLHHLPGAPKPDEMVSRFRALIGYLFQTNFVATHANDLGRTLQARLQAVDNFCKALALAGKEVGQEVEASILNQFGFQLQPYFDGESLWLGDDFRDLECPFMPIARLFEGMESHGLLADESFLFATKAAGDTAFPVQKMGRMTDHVKACCLAYILENAAYKPSGFRDALLNVISSRINSHQVDWCKLTAEETIRLYRHNPFQSIVETTPHPRVRDSIFCSDLGL